MLQNVEQFETILFTLSKQKPRQLLDMYSQNS
jgi:hypothetical protein